MTDGPYGRTLRFGLAGTGYWARTVHGPALAAAPDIELTGVWGRNPAAAADLAGPLGAAAYSDFDSLLADVDAVAFSLPPDVQSTLALRAARAGKHLLLEKPIGLTDQAADALVEAAADARVASVVFFTARFQPEVRAWLAEVTGGPWAGGRAVWLGSALAASSPFNTPWRRDKGGLWDLGPHVVSLLAASLGPVAGVTADGGPLDVAHLILQHEGGPSSTVTVTVHAPPSDDALELYLWGQAGRSDLPGASPEPVRELQTALAELVASVRSGRPHPCDVRFGREVNRVLAEADRQIAARRGT
jgi:predicted dehydrogenase